MNKKNSIIYKIYTNFFHNKVEDEISKILSSFKKKKLDILDIGCFQGKFSEKMNNLLKKKFKIKFYLFDPNPNSKNYLNNLKINFIFLNVAIDIKDGVGKFYFNNQFEGSGSSLSALFSRNKYYNISRRIFFLSVRPLFSVIKVKKIKLSSIFRKYKFKVVDVLKIDADGSELNILKSGERYLSKTNIIYVEISDKKKTWDEKYKKIYNILKKKGFIYHKVFRIPEGSIFTNLKLCDCIFIKKKLAKRLKQ